MRKHSLVAYLLFALVVAGCDTGTLVDPGNQAAEVAGKAATMVPVKGSATFAADMTVVPPVLDCGSGQVFFRRFTGEGVFSHLGLMTIVIESSECWLDFGDGTLNVKGSWAQRAANGDMLYGTWGGKMYEADPAGGPNPWVFYAHDSDHPLEYTGGTGRFLGVTGFAEGGGTFDATSLSGSYRLEGVISSVGSLK